MKRGREAEGERDPLISREEREEGGRERRRKRAREGRLADQGVDRRSLEQLTRVELGWGEDRLEEDRKTW